MSEATTTAASVGTSCAFRYCLVLDRMRVTAVRAEATKEKVAEMHETITLIVFIVLFVQLCCSCHVCRCRPRHLRRYPTTSSLNPPCPLNHNLHECHNHLS